MSRRTTVEIARESGPRLAFGHPFRAYFGDLGFSGHQTEALRRPRRRLQKSLRHSVPAFLEVKP